MNDRQLIDSYVQENSEAAFRALVERHAGLVYASALRQVGNAELARDVAQAVFILFARKADSLGRSIILSGWLFQTTRHVAARAVRSEQRRQRRELEAFAMQQLNATDPAWPQMTPFIDEALGQLGHTDRNAILLRYLEGRSLKEVGTALGLTEEAAKKRVSRAMEKLRSTLGRNGLVLATTTLAAALASHATAASAPDLVTALSQSALAAANPGSATPALVEEILREWRWTKLKWAAAAALPAVIAVTVFFVPLKRSMISWMDTPAIAPASALLTPPAELAGQNVRPANPGDSNLKHLKFRVVSKESGHAIPQAAVFMSVWRNETIENHFDLVTDADGFCAIAFEPDAGRLDVGVLAPGWAARYCTWPSEGEAGFPSEYVLRLTPITNRIGGTILDLQGRPLAGVQLFFHGHDSGDSSHRERPRERFGFVYPVPATQTDQEGRWTLAFIPPAHRGFDLEARHPGFADTSLIASPPQENDDELENPFLTKLWAGQLRSTMNEAWALAGTVVDEEERPIARAKIQQRSGSDSWFTDAAGQFRIPKLTEGAWAFTVSAEGFAPCRTQAWVGARGAPPHIRLAPGGVLRVRVVDEEGREVPDAEVGLEQWGHHRHNLDWRERTDFQGRLEWRSAPPDLTLELFARKEGFCYTRDVRVKANGDLHEILLHHALVVHGRVVDAETGRALRDFKAIPAYGALDRFHDSSSRWYAGETVRGTNGLFRLTFGEKQFPWQVRVTAEGYEDWTSQPLTNRIQVVLDIPMTRSKLEEQVRGIVLGPDGQAAAGAQVALLTFEHNVTLRKRSFEGNSRWLTRTDARGEFVFPANRLAHSVAAVSGHGYAHSRVRDFREPLALRLEAWGRVEGKVDESAAIHGVATIQLYDPTVDNYQGRVSTLNSYAAKPDPSRQFAFEFVPPGEFSVFVNSRNGVPFHHQTPITVRPGATTQVVITEADGTRVSGRLLAPPGRALSWASDLIACQFYIDLPQASSLIDEGPAAERPLRELEFWSSAAGRDQVNTPRVYSGLVRQDGSFVSLEKLPPGRFRFRAVCKQGSATRELTIRSGTEEISLGDIPMR